VPVPFVGKGYQGRMLLTHQLSGGMISISQSIRGGEVTTIYISCQDHHGNPNIVVHLQTTGLWARWLLSAPQSVARIRQLPDRVYTVTHKAKYTSPALWSTFLCMGRPKSNQRQWILVANYSKSGARASEPEIGFSKWRRGSHSLGQMQFASISHRFSNETIMLLKCTIPTPEQSLLWSSMVMPVTTAMSR